MAKLTPKQRAKLPSRDFGLPEKARSSDAKKETGNYPMPDKDHAVKREAALPTAAKDRQPHEGRVRSCEPEGGQGPQGQEEELRRRREGRGPPVNVIPANCGGVHRTLAVLADRSLAIAPRWLDQPHADDRVGTLDLRSWVVLESSFLPRRHGCEPSGLGRNETAAVGGITATVPVATCGQASQEDDLRNGRPSPSGSNNIRGAFERPGGR